MNKFLISPQLDYGLKYAIELISVKGTLRYDVVAVYPHVYFVTLHSRPVKPIEPFQEQGNPPNLQIVSMISNNPLDTINSLWYLS